MLLATNLLGLMAFYVADRQQRRAFLQTRQSLEMKLVIEEQSAEQERLLLSVLPEHVAVRMRQDLGSAKDGQFKKIYMSRHENRYQQLRIKILGDCYYCISGAPRERPDHAVLCVHMGLSMVKAIKRVHISEKTLGFLNGEFEVEPALGEKREEMLRMAGIRTFFIVRALKPFQPELSNGSLQKAAEAGDIDIKEKDSVGGATEEAASGEKEMNGRVRSASDDFKQRLRSELVSRDGQQELRSHTHALALTFGDAAKEQAYQRHRDALSSVSLLGCPLAQLLAGAARLLKEENIKEKKISKSFHVLAITNFVIMPLNKNIDE
ncbi:Adenylate cyclase type 3, partial [Gryllus bimaculatus]